MQTRNVSILFTFLLSSMVCHAQTATIDPNQKFAWAENIGWINWLPVNLPVEQQVYIQSTFIRGYVWGENVGWISLGNTPLDGQSYANIDGSDVGVNVDQDGTLSGYAWAENIGWINFNTLGALGPFGENARIDRAGKRIRGFAWAENVGWINFDDSEHFIGLIVECVADVNGDGELSPADFTAWLAAYGKMNPVADQNGDGVVTPGDFTAWLSNYNIGCD